VEDAITIDAITSSVKGEVEKLYAEAPQVDAGELASLENETEKMFDNWITSARSALADVQAVGGLNVVLTAAPLKGSIAKLILFGMAQYVPLEYVYSANGGAEGGKSKVGGEAIQKGKKVYGRKAKVIVIGAKGKEEEELASMQGAKFMKIADPAALIDIKAQIEAL